MCKTPDVLLKKRQFIERYNPTREIDTALASAMTASLQHNEIWGFDTSPKRKELIKDVWRDTLKFIAKKYENEKTEKEFEQDIQDLQLIMNDNYKNYFTTEGFKISHSQKSLSVFLKILWADGKIKTPPLCPVDRIILQAAGERSPKSWTQVNTMREYRQHVLILKRGARNHKCNSLACWELFNFNPNR